MSDEAKGSVLYQYLETDNAELFAVVCLPEQGSTFPVVIYRNPYVDSAEKQTEEEICTNKLCEYKGWLDHGYAVVFQHCRGRGKSSGDCVPYIFEKEHPQKEVISLYTPEFAEDTFVKGKMKAKR